MFSFVSAFLIFFLVKIMFFCQYSQQLLGLECFKQSLHSCQCITEDCKEAFQHGFTNELLLPTLASTEFSASLFPAKTLLFHRKPNSDEIHKQNQLDRTGNNNSMPPIISITSQNLILMLILNYKSLQHQALKLSISEKE